MKSNKKNIQAQYNKKNGNLLQNNTLTYHIITERISSKNSQKKVHMSRFQPKMF